MHNYGVILNQSTTECKVICSSQTTEDFIAAEEDIGEGVDHNFFRCMCGLFQFEHVTIIIILLQPSGVS